MHATGGFVESMRATDNSSELVDALRSSRTLTTLAMINLELWNEPSAVAALLSALVGHPTLCTLNLSYNDPKTHRAAAGAAIAELLAADTLTLTALDVSGWFLGSMGLAPICTALQRNTHLRELTLIANNVSEDFARVCLYPLVKTKTMLCKLCLLDADDFNQNNDDYLSAVQMFVASRARLRG